jgi:hypothetical protein
MKNLVLVYQVGIANVFQVDCFNQSPYGRNAKRVYQGSFFGAEHWCHGAAFMGAKIASMACNMAGDVWNGVSK